MIVQNAHHRDGSKAEPVIIIVMPVVLARGRYDDRYEAHLHRQLPNSDGARQ